MRSVRAQKTFCYPTERILSQDGKREVYLLTSSGFMVLVMEGYSLFDRLLRLLFEL